MPPPAGRGSAFSMDTGLAWLTQFTVNSRDLWMLEPAVSSTKENASVYQGVSVERMTCPPALQDVHMADTCDTQTFCFVFVFLKMSRGASFAGTVLFGSQGFSGSDGRLCSGNLQAWIKWFSFKCHHCQGSTVFTALFIVTNDPSPRVLSYWDYVKMLIGFAPVFPSSSSHLRKSIWLNHIIFVTYIFISSQCCHAVSAMHFISLWATSKTEFGFLILNQSREIYSCSALMECRLTDILI